MTRKREVAVLVFSGVVIGIIGFCVGRCTCRRELAVASASRPTVADLATWVDADPDRMMRHVYRKGLHTTELYRERLGPYFIRVTRKRLAECVRETLRAVAERRWEHKEDDDE